jgi:hypothetical protein
MSATDKPETPEAQATQPTPTPEELIQRCMERATKITYRKRQGKKGTSITISFERSR